jgi:hypothetical protein
MQHPKRTFVAWLMLSTVVFGTWWTYFVWNEQMPKPNDAMIATDIVFLGAVAALMTWIVRHEWRDEMSFFLIISLVVGFVLTGIAKLRELPLLGVEMALYDLVAGILIVLWIRGRKYDQTAQVFETTEILYAMGLWMTLSLAYHPSDALSGVFLGAIMLPIGHIFNVTIGRAIVVGLTRLGHTLVPEQPPKPKD